MGDTPEVETAGVGRLGRLCRGGWCSAEATGRPRGLAAKCWLSGGWLERELLLLLAGSLYEEEEGGLGEGVADSSRLRLEEEEVG